MCNPVAIAVIGLALTAASTGVAVSEQDQNTRAQNKINQKASDEGAAAAAESFKQEAGQARLRDAQEAEAALQEKTLNAQKASQARETARVSAGEAGVAGVSVDNLLADYYRQEASFNGSMNRNLEFTTSQTDQTLKGMRSGAIDRQIAERRPQINRPSYLASGLSFGAQSLQTYDSFKVRTDKTYRGEG